MRIEKHKHIPAMEAMLRESEEINYIISGYTADVLDVMEMDWNSTAATGCTTSLNYKRFPACKSLPPGNICQTIHGKPDLIIVRLR
jgi:hypothetical protein